MQLSLQDYHEIGKQLQSHTVLHYVEYIVYHITSVVCISSKTHGSVSSGPKTLHATPWV